MRIDCSEWYGAIQSIERDGLTGIPQNPRVTRINRVPTCMVLCKLDPRTGVLTCMKRPSVRC